jgi:hypothetical protein
MKKNLTLVVVISLLSIDYCFSQKKDINQEVLYDIVETKLKESTVRGIYTAANKYFKNDRNLFLEPYYKKFTYNSLDILFKEKNKKTLKNKILAESIEFAINVLKDDSFKKTILVTKNINNELKLIDNNIIGNIKKYKLHESFGNTKINEVDKSSFMRLDNHYFKKINNKEIKSINLSNNLTLYINAIDLDTISNDFIDNSSCIKSLDTIVGKLRSNKKIEINKIMIHCILDLVDSSIKKLDIKTNGTVIKSSLPHIILSVIRDNIHEDEDDEKPFIDLDPEAIISSLFQRFDGYIVNNSIATSLYFINPRPFFNLGVNYIYFPNGNNSVNPSEGKFYGAAILSEKIGFQFKINDFKYARSFKKGESFRYRGRNYVRLTEPKDPYISNIYWSIYGSGILYNIINSSTKENFSAPLIGLGLGVTLFNGLRINGSFGYAINSSENKFNSDNTFISIGLDVPLIEYIQAIRNK